MSPKICDGGKGGEGVEKTLASKLKKKGSAWQSANKLCGKTNLQKSTRKHDPINKAEYLTVIGGKSLFVVCACCFSFESDCGIVRDCVSKKTTQWNNDNKINKQTNRQRDNVYISSVKIEKNVSFYFDFVTSTFV